MKILHTADIHLGELAGPVVNGENARMMDTVRCMDYLITKGVEENIDVALIAGDLFHKSKLWADQMLKEIGIAASWLRRLAEVAPVVLMFGTANHDNAEAFENIKAMGIPDLFIVSSPQVLTIKTKSGPLQVAAVPGYDKGYFRAKYPGMDPQEENAMCSNFLGDIILGLGAQIDQSIPSVLMSHYTVVGCQLENGEHIFTQSDVVLPKDALAASPFNIVALGHIHRAQEVEHCGRPTFYSGPVNGITFNEEGQDKGFWIHEIGAPDTFSFKVHENSMEDCPPDAFHEDGNHIICSNFIKTPSREFLTQQWDEQNVETFLTYSDGNPSWLLGQQVKDKIIRIHYTCSDELNKQFNRKVLEKALYDADAFYVSEIKPVQIITALQKQEMSENSDPLTNLTTWAKREGFEEAEINALIELAKPLIATVSANMPTGKLSGMFVPGRIEVKNYRSYREESFDFGQINFATVNGPNGVGKSALFMDAVCDCLFEEPREGDLTGWITNDESARSGAITFEFAMGDTNWRVTRTRAKSGKTTLTMAELVNGQWEDRSCDKVKDTQDKIIALLGMDAMTFRCCALIMQDAYGIFMEADKEDRMQVLANILGLNIYEQLTDLAKAKVTEINRELTKAKDKLAELDLKLNTKAGIDAELADVNSDLTVIAHDISEKEAALKEAQELVRQLTAKKEKAEDLQRQIETATGEIATKKQEKNSQQDQLDKANEKLSYEEKINEKAAEYEQVKEQVTVLRVKQPQLEQVKSEASRIAEDVDKVELNIKKLDEQIGGIEVLLANRDELEKDAQEFQKISVEIETLDTLAEQWRELDTQLKGNKFAYDAAVTKYENEKGQISKDIDDCRKRTEVLDTLSCSEYDTCPLVAQAVKARDSIPALEEKLANLDKTQMEALEAEGIALQEKRNSLDYDQSKHIALKNQAIQLKPKAEQAAELSGKAELLNNLNEQRTQQIEQKYQLLQRHTEIDGQVKALDEELKPLADLEIRLPKLDQWVKAKEELPAARQVVETATQRIADLDKEIVAKELGAKSLEQAQSLIFDELGPGYSHLVNAKSNVEQFNNTIAALRNKQNELHGKAGGLKANLDALQKDQEERNHIAEEMKPTAQLVVRYQTLAKAFGFDGIPFSIVRAVVPELSAMANEILGQMTGGKMSLEMRTEKVQKSNKKEVNALEIWITDYQRGTLPYKSRSGGQKVKAALSVAFALADLKARRAGIQLGMLFIDEPPFLDGEGTEAYCDALELVSQRYPNMIVLAISHDPRMKARFPQMIDVIDTENGSKVKVA